MKAFKPCQGKDYCRDDGVTCHTCGRTVREIMDTRRLIEGLAQLALDHGYDNVDEFANYVARKTAKVVRHRRAGGVVED